MSADVSGVGGAGQARRPELHVQAAGAAPAGADAVAARRAQLWDAVLTLDATAMSDALARMPGRELAAALADATAAERTQIAGHLESALDELRDTLQRSDWIDTLKYRLDQLEPNRLREVRRDFAERHLEQARERQLMVALDMVDGQARGTAQRTFDVRSAQVRMAAAFHRYEWAHGTLDWMRGYDGSTALAFSAEAKAGPLANVAERGAAFDEAVAAAQREALAFMTHAARDAFLQAAAAAYRTGEPREANALAAWGELVLMVRAASERHGPERAERHAAMLVTPRTSNERSFVYAQRPLFEAMMNDLGRLEGGSLSAADRTVLERIRAVLAPLHEAAQRYGEANEALTAPLPSVSYGAVEALARLADASRPEAAGLPLEAAHEAEAALDHAAERLLASDEAMRHALRNERRLIEHESGADNPAVDALRIRVLGELQEMRRRSGAAEPAMVPSPRGLGPSAHEEWVTPGAAFLYAIEHYAVLPADDDVDAQDARRRAQAEHLTADRGIYAFFAEPSPGLRFLEQRAQ